jgi:hypothetical protein
MADAVEKPRPKKTHSRGFLAANLVVAAGFVAVLVLFAFLVSRGTSNSWSTYKPNGGDVFTKAQNMADHVAPAYKYNGAPIAVVQAQPLLYQDAVVDGIAFTRQPFRKIGSPFKQFEPSGSTVAYVFCGTAPRCGLPSEGAETTVPLLRRETLELALYTFKYTPSVDSIVGLLPPAGNTNYAIYLRRRNFQKELSKPLDATLPQHKVLSYQQLSPVEKATVDRLTMNNTYQSQFSQGANGRTLLVLRSVGQ